jgi:hypothetical protein
VGTRKEKAQGKREKTVRYRTAGGVPTWAAGWIARGGGVRVNVVIGGDTIGNIGRMHYDETKQNNRQPLVFFRRFLCSTVDFSLIVSAFLVSWQDQ